MVYSLLILFIGLFLVVYFSEKLVEATVGTSVSFGISTFLISVVVIGFDPENLGLGAVASYEGTMGIAVGTIIGSAMVAVALALGITALIAPMKFEQVPLQIPLILVLAVVLFGVLSFDGLLSRFDGFILLSGYLGAIWYVFSLSLRGVEVRAAGESTKIIEEGIGLTQWKAAGMLVLSLGVIILGSKLVIYASENIMAKLGLSDTVFGITVVALMLSIEEIARELPAAVKGRPEITFGNVLGSVLAFFLCNAGVIALIHPIPISAEVFNFYLPMSLGAVLFVTLLMIRKSISRWSGAVLVLAYLIFFAQGYF